MAETAASGGNVFTRHIGPLPMWGWTAIVGAIIVGWAWWKNRNSTASSSSTTADASQVPQFVNQTYTTVSPPSAPAGPPPATGPYRPGGPNVNLAGQARPDLQKKLATDSDDKKPPAKKPTGPVHKKAPKPKAPSRKGGPVRRG